MKSTINPSNWQLIHESPSEGRRRWQIKQRKKEMRRLAFVTAVLLILTAVGVIFAYRQINQKFTPLETAGKIITVKNGANLQAAINRAQPGDTIVLEAGAEFIGSFELPRKNGAEFITIQSSAVEQLPANIRVQPDRAAHMPKILSPGKGLAAIYAAPGANHYRFIGVEISIVSRDYVYNLVDLGVERMTAEQMPHFFEFDRCYIHTLGLNNAQRGIALNSSDTIIKNSYIAGFGGNKYEPQAIAGWGGAGRYKIINNYIEGSGQNILFGGSDPDIKNLVPTDIEILHNHLTKPESWKGQSIMKSFVQLKNAKQVFIAGNIIENCVDCEAFVLSVRNQDGKAPWSVVEDVEFRHNIVRNVGHGIHILGRDDLHPSQKLKRVKIVNNLWESISHPDGGFFFKGAEAENVEISHNTVFHNGKIFVLHGAPISKFAFKNNILSFNNYGIWGENMDGGITGVMHNYFPNGLIRGNIITNELSVEQVTFLPQNHLVDKFAAVGFVNLKEKDFRLQENSKFKGKGDGGRDVGCDFNALQAAVADVETSAKAVAAD